MKKAKEKEAARIKEAADEEKRKRDAEEKLRKTDEALTEAVRQVNVDEANVVPCWNGCTEHRIQTVSFIKLSGTNWMRKTGKESSCLQYGHGNRSRPRGRT